MNVNLKNWIHDKLGGSASRITGEILGRSSDQMRASVKHTIDSVVNEFAVVADDVVRREGLYQAIKSSDDYIVEEADSQLHDRERRDAVKDENDRLVNVIGIANRNRLIENLRAGNGFSSSEAQDVLGIVTPGVLACLKSKVVSGEVRDSTAGVATLFATDAPLVSTGQSESGVRSINSGANKTSVARSTEAVGSGSAVVAQESDSSWMRRFALPFLLLGALLLGGIKYCSNAEESRIVAEERTTLRQKLDGATAKTAELNTELEVSNADVARLQGEVDTVNATLESTEARSLELSGQVEQVTAELTAVKDVPVETVELQGLLASVTAERDVTNSARNELQGALDQVTGERDVALEEGVNLQAELDEARALMEVNEEKIATVDALKLNVEELTASRDDTLARNEEYKVAGIKLQEQVDTLTPTISELESQLQSVTAERKGFEESLALKTTALDEEKLSRESDIDRLNEVSAGLQVQLDASGDEIQKLKLQVEDSSQTRAALEEKLATTSDSLDEERSARQVDVNRLSASSSDLQGQLTQMLGLRDETLGTLSLRDEQVSSLGEKVTGLEGDVITLQNANDKARQEANELEQKIQGLNSELEVTQAQVDETEITLVQREEALGAVNTDLEMARADIQSLSAERDQLLSKRDALAGRVAELIAENDTAAAKSVNQSEQISALNLDLEDSRTSDASSQDKLALLSTSFTGLQDELGLMVGARDEASAQVSQLQTEVSNLESSKASLESQMGQAQEAHSSALAAMQGERDNTLADLSGVKTELNAEIDNLTNQRDTALEKIDEVNSELAALTTQKAAAQKSMDELQSQTNALQSTLKNEQSTVAQLNSSVADLGGKNSELVDQRDGALGEIEILQANLKDADDQINSLTGQRNTLEGEIEDSKAKSQSARDATLAVRTSIEQQLNDAGITSASVKMLDDERSVSITLGSGDLYQVGSASLSRQGTAVMSNVGSIVAGYPEWQVDVEGHTDSQGIGAELRKRYPTNWELSTARASAAVRFLTAKSGIDSGRLSASGLGDTRPLESNDSAKGRERNRRVDIILRP